MSFYLHKRKNDRTIVYDIGDEEIQNPNQTKCSQCSQCSQCANNVYDQDFPNSQHLERMFTLSKIVLRKKK